MLKEKRCHSDFNRIKGSDLRDKLASTPCVATSYIFFTLVRPNLNSADKVIWIYIGDDDKKIFWGQETSHMGKYKHLNLHYQERQRVWGDLIKVLEWMNTFNEGAVNKVLVVTEADKTCLTRTLVKKCLTIRVVDEWNKRGSHVGSDNTYIQKQIR